MSKDRSSYQRKKHPWAVALSGAFQKWLNEHGYDGDVVFANEIGINNYDMHDIRHGRRITMNPETYAKIFLRTGLQEADPRKVPPRPGSKGGERDRAWTEEQWQQWKAQNSDLLTREVSPTEESLQAKEGTHGTDLSQQKEESAVPPSGSVQNKSEEPTVGNLLDGFIAILSRQMGQPVMAQVVQSQQELQTTVLTIFSLLQQQLASIQERVEQLEKQSPAGSSTQKSNVSDLTARNVRELAEALSKKLTEYAEGDEEKRNSLDTETVASLARVSPLARILSSEPKTREKSIGMFALNLQQEDQ